LGALLIKWVIQSLLEASVYNFPQAAIGRRNVLDEFAFYIVDGTP
jgi:hypothetical protein